MASSSGDLNRQLVAATAARTSQIVEALGLLSEEGLLSPSRLPGWSRLTIACHLRYGAKTLCRMTRASLTGQPAAYYPGRRNRQRPHTLAPHPGERPGAVVASLAIHSDELERVWSSLDRHGWASMVVEPDDNPDLGAVELARLPLLRLTEVEVHGSDLGLGLDDWSDLFVRVVLPMRLDWLNERRSNHRDFDERLEGSWLLIATDGPTYRISVNGTTVESHPADPSSRARAVVEASSRDLLALLLGRSLRGTPRLTGDTAFARAFTQAFPGP